MAKPVIGAINGPCVTGGFELALACDFLVASERAAFADTHARVGVMPAGGMSVFLPQVVGVRKAKEMSLSGNFMGAHEAFARGLVNHVVAHDDLLPGRREARGGHRGQRPGRGAEPQEALRREREGDRRRRRSTRSRSTSAPGRIDPAEIERRRAGIVERGRDQQ